jgi:hypothetical protein
MIFMIQLTLGGNFFIRGKLAELKPFSIVSQGIRYSNFPLTGLTKFQGINDLHTCLPGWE